MSLAYARFRRQFAALTGIALGADRQYIAESRLSPVLRAHNVRDLLELTRIIDGRENETLVKEVIDAMTTNETSFFRDRAPFDEFRDRVLPELMAARANERRLRIWCAAASTGQEVYSLAMTLDHEARALRGWSVEYAGLNWMAKAFLGPKRDRPLLFGRHGTPPISDIESLYGRIFS